jgi:hypothetical protein
MRYDGDYDETGNGGGNGYREISDSVSFIIECSNNHNRKYLCTIRDITPFKGTFVILNSHFRRTQRKRKDGSVVVYCCSDCKRYEKDCGPFSIYHTVVDGVPKQLCESCVKKYNDKGLWSNDHVTKFYELLNAYARIVGTLTCLFVWDCLFVFIWDC